MRNEVGRAKVLAGEVMRSSEIQDLFWGLPWWYLLIYQMRTVAEKRHQTRLCDFKPSSKEKTSTLFHQLFSPFFLCLQNLLGSYLFPFSIFTGFKSLLLKLSSQHKLAVKAWNTLKLTCAWNTPFSNYIFLFGCAFFLQKFIYSSIHLCIRITSIMTPVILLKGSPCKF